jgi:hypothetical protein
MSSNIILATEQAGLYACARHGYDVTLPFEIDYRFPKPDDKRTRGYSPAYVKRLGIELSC